MVVLPEFLNLVYFTHSIWCLANVQIDEMPHSTKFYPSTAFFLHKYVVCIKTTVLLSFCKGKDGLIIHDHRK
jgi:hypothetical protein